jgi:tetratricopeptide (TPR) repeat protein
VSGTYFLRGDSIQIQANLVETRTGKLIAGLEPVGAPTSDPLAGGRSLSDRVLAAVSAQFGGGEFALETARVPRSYEAYREFVTGLELGRSTGWTAALPRLERALALDSTFYPTAIYLALTYATVGGRLPSLDTLVVWLNSKRDQLNEFERLWLDHYEAFGGGDLSRSYRAHKSLAALRPNDPLQRYMLGQYALRTNRLVEAADVLLRPPNTTYTDRYWDNLTSSLHLLGEHDRELEVALAGRAELPDSRLRLGSHLRALIGLGRTDEARGMINEIMNFPAGLPGQTLDAVALELRAHGHPVEARELGEQAIAWYRDRLESDATNTEVRHQFGHALYNQGYWDEAVTVFTELHEENASFVGYLGMQGAALAQLGRRAEAEEIDRQLAAWDGTYYRGQHTFRRAAIAAVLGDRERAVDLLIQAHQQGQIYGLWTHRAVSFDSLQGYDRFEDFIRPRTN